MAPRFIRSAARLSSTRAGSVLSVALGVLWLSLAGLSSAQPAPPAPAAPSGASSASVAPPPISGPALLQASHMLARDIASVSAGAVVAGSTLESDVAAPRGPELVTRLVSLVAGALGPEAHTGRSPATVESARAEAGSATVLVFVKVQLAQGELRASADVFPIVRNVWERARNPAPGPIAHGYGHARIDAEVRSYLAPVPLVASQTIKVPSPEPEILALLCEDVDGDDALELVVASRRSVLVGRVRDKRFDVIRKAAWDSFAPIAPVPWRQPLMSIAWSATGTFDVGSTDRARAVRLDGMLAMREPLDGFPVPLPDGSACVQRETGSLAKELAACTAQGVRPSLADMGFSFDGAAAAKLIRADGRVDGVTAVRRVSDTSVVLRDQQGRTVSVPNTGAQLAVGDLDLDGNVELVSSRNVLDAAQDGLSVRTWRGEAAVQERWSVPVPQGVSAIAICPPDGGALRTIAVATSSELWLIR